MEELLNTLRGEAQRVYDENASVRMAIVDGYDPKAYAARVRLQPDNTLTGWLPIATIRAGNKAGLYAPPNIGDQVEVQFQESGLESGIVHGAFYSKEDVPLPVPAGEIWVVHEGGSIFKILPDGKIEIEAPGGVTLKGNLAVTGGITATEDVKAGTVSLRTHRNTGVQTGGGISGPPQT